MSDSELEESVHDPLAILKYPNFVKFTVSRSFSTLGMALLQAVMAWQVYDISGSAFYLGLLGLLRFVPALALSLVGGAVADTYNRRTIIIIAQIVPLACAIILSVASFGHWAGLELIFGLVVALGVASSFESPARQAMLPALVPHDDFASAVTVSQTLQSLGMMSGPAIAGGIIAAAGVGTAYGFFVVVSFLALVSLLMMTYKQDLSIKKTVSVESIKEGIRFVRQRPVILGAMSLDMFAVLFGGAQALLPVYAKDILHAGPIGYGILYSSLDIGSFMMATVMVMRRPVVKTGRTLIWVVIIYGFFTMAFGFSRIFALSVVFYGLIGMSDQVSMVMRNMIIQLSTPDELRGRVSAVSQVFIGASNQVGAMESGFVAAVTSATFAVVSGGIAAMGIAGFIGWRNKALYHYEIPRVAKSIPVPVPVAEPAAAGGGS